MSGLSTDQVRSYAVARNVPVASVSVAVLIQRLVLAEAAGVAFTRDPLSGATVVAIEANYGFGETIVDGSVVPDAYSVHGDELIDQRIGTKLEKAICDSSGLRRVRTTVCEQARMVLNATEVEAVATLARRVESSLGFPVNIEWALAKHDLLLLQARPLTARSVRA